MLALVLALIGGLAGFAFLGWSMGGFAAGAAIGAVMGWSSELRDRVLKLERRLGRLEAFERQTAYAPAPEQGATAPNAVPDAAPHGRAWPAPDSELPVPEPSPLTAAAAQLRAAAPGPELPDEPLARELPPSGATAPAEG